jgi:hypothetical protein
LTHPFQASPFPKEELVPAGNPTFPRFPKEPCSSRYSNLPAIPEGTMFQLVNRPSRDSKGTMFQPANQPSRDSRRNHVPAGQPTFPRFPKEPCFSRKSDLPAIPQEPCSSRYSNLPAIPEGTMFQPVNRPSHDSTRTMFQPVFQPSRDSRRNHVPAGQPTFPRFQRNHVSAGNPFFPQFPKEPRSEQVMSHPQVGRSWLVHPSEEELSHHLQPPHANQQVLASPLPKKRFIIYRPVEPSRKQVVATAPRGCWTILIRRPLFRPRSSRPIPKYHSTRLG